MKRSCVAVARAIILNEKIGVIHNVERNAYGRAGRQVRIERSLNRHRRGRRSTTNIIVVRRSCTEKNYLYTTYVYTENTRKTKKKKKKYRFGPEKEREKKKPASTLLYTREIR